MKNIPITIGTFHINIGEDIYQNFKDSWDVIITMATLMDYTIVPSASAGVLHVYFQKGEIRNLKVEFSVDWGEERKIKNMVFFKYGENNWTIIGFDGMQKLLEEL